MAGTGMAAMAGVPLGTRPGCRVGRVPTARPPIFRRFPAVETAGYRCQDPTGHWLRVVSLASFSLIAVNNSG